MKASIRIKIMGALFLIALLSFTATIYYSFAGMKRFMSAALSYGDRQGQVLTRDSRAALIKRINSDLINTAVDQARIVGLLQENISGAVAGVIDDLMAGRLYLGGGNPKLFRTLDAKPEHPEKYALCYFTPDTEKARQSPEGLRALTAAIPFLFELRKSSPFIHTAVVVLPDGVHLFHPWRELPSDYDARKRQWYRKALEAKGKICWMESDDRSVICAMAAYEGKRLLGVAAVEVPIDPLSSQVTAIRSGYLSFLTDSEGKIISGSKEFQDFSGSTEELQENIKKGEKGIFLLKSGGESLLATSAPIPGCGWNLVICQPENLAMKGIHDMEKMLKTERELAQHTFERKIHDMGPIYIGISAVILLLILLLGYFLAKQLTRPIATLMKNAHAIGNGHLEHKIKLHTGDELEQLANTINQMADDLTRYIQNLNQAVSERQRVEAELRTAAEIQSSMLPEPISERADLDICAVMKPAREVGGDLYDYVFIDPNHLFFVVGDVSGKGIPAALFMATAKTLMRGFARNALSPAEILQLTNNYLEEENDKCMFITVFCGLLDCVTGEVVCCNAGHNPPVYLKPDGNSSLLRLPAGFPLGPFPQETPGFYSEEHFQLNPGETLVLYTDGVTEALNRQNEQFGTGRLQLALSAAPPGRNTLKQTMKSLLHILQSYTENAGQSDDLTVLMVQYKGAPKK
ncbi:MAG: SpoIIE family protein phosphatase [Lentisphaeria bacterium]|nr:SpoIIE family protein phosphatase [Lentisphaeria bacterium]